MTEKKTVSPGTLLMAVVTALLVGVLGSLAIRPPGASAPHVDERANTGFENVRWRATSSFSANLPIIGTSPQRITEELARVTGGAFQMKVYNPGEVVPTMEMTESIKEGKIEAGFQWLGYDQGRIPASALISAVPFGMEPMEFLAWWFHGNGRQLTERLYEPHNVMPILCGLIGPETAGWFREPIESLDDLIGLKIRFAGLGGKVLQRLGASVTLIPAAELFQALEKGAIDATEFSMPVIDEMLGFSRVAKFNYFPGWHQVSSAFHFQVNLTEWNRLNEETRVLIRITCQAATSLSLAESEALQGAVIRDYESKGVTAGQLSPEILEELRAITQEVLDEGALNDEQFAEILQSQREFSATYRYWKTRGYLPRLF